MAKTWLAGIACTVAPISGQAPAQFRRIRLVIALRKLLGMALTLNFALFWALPITLQGHIFHRGLHRLMRPVFRLLDRSAALRRIAVRHVYRRPVHADYFATALLLSAGTATSLAAVFAWQISSGGLPWWLLAAYYFAWVGFGGRGMGAAYTLAHREGHASAGRLYRPWIAERFGNIFENYVGLWYGIVPHSFSTSHILLHHRLNAGKADPLYVWDLDRTKFGDFLLYQWRAFDYMTGFRSFREFHRQRGVYPAIYRATSALRSGMIIYWIYMPVAIIVLLVATGSSITSSIIFLFFVYIQPLIAMSSFIALLTVAQHAFLDYDHAGRNLKHVAAITILDGHDDSFGEDDHFTHHYFPAVTHSELSRTQLSQELEWAQCHGAVFKGTSIVEIGLLLLLGRIDRLIDRYYVDFSGTLEKQELIALFTSRARRKEMSYENYEFRYIPQLRSRVRDAVRQGQFENENQAYIFQAHYKVNAGLEVDNI